MTVEILKPGAKLREAVSGVEAVLVRAPSDAGLGLRAGGPVSLGKRYVCSSCKAEILVTKGGDGEGQCHGLPMVMAQAKALPSSD